ncbi:hypothetical protein LSTR_LSTR016455 [Laodelphax striatellus]|uniref:Uncharacterized protein n=1 Tax=Laodelphax striatellus TaxID=195883 RepID=A0A482WZB4_LAOST|nr:hypothetical protein LSTR_LSTR016455 [Laodelphax striatellus]
MWARREAEVAAQEAVCLLTPSTTRHWAHLPTRLASPQRRPSSGTSRASSRWLPTMRDSRRGRSTTRKHAMNITYDVPVKSERAWGT